MILLAGDVGGTKTRLALVENGDILHQKQYLSNDYSGLADIVEIFLKAYPKPVVRACFGVAGPVVGDVCQATNLPWLIAARDLEKCLLISRVSLVNDFHALAVGVMELPTTDFSVLNDAPCDPRGPWVVLGAGTGLGEAVVQKGPEGFEILTSEGGHTDFGPRSELEIELWRFLMKRHGRVSYERIVSGPGLVAVYDFLKEKFPQSISPDIENERTTKEADSAAIIATHAMAKTDSLCVQALDMFVSIYGSEAGNLGLKVMAPGGIFVAGGIAPKILPKMMDGTFLKAFLDKGRMTPILERTSVKLVTNPYAGLVGAAAIAAQH